MNGKEKKKEKEVKIGASYSIYLAAYLVLENSDGGVLWLTQ